MCGLSKTIWVLLISVGVGLWVQFVKKGHTYAGKHDLSGRTVIVTGANSGIGYETALGLLKQNAKVIIACRNEQKAQTAIVKMKKESGRNTIDYMIVDFADMASMRSAAKKLIEKEERLDILVNNAGGVWPGKTKDGLNMIFGVNHIGYFMFTNLLMPLMRKTCKKNPVRIVNVASEGYKFGRIDFDNLNPENSLDSGLEKAMDQYDNTKLMNVHFTNELDARLKEEFKGQDQAITTYSLYPGVIKTSFGTEFANDLGISYNLLRHVIVSLFARPTVYGAQTVLYCSLEKGIEKYSGGYFSNLKHTELWSHALDPDIGKRLWEVSEEICGVRW